MGTDFDTTQLATDLDAIADATLGAGENIRYNSTTYEAVFSEVSAELSFELEGREDKRAAVMIMPRSVLTAGIPIDSSIYRPFDSTTYAVIDRKSDEQAWEYRVVRPY